MITEQDTVIVAKVYAWLEAKARGKYRASLRIDGVEDVRIMLTDDNYNTIFSHSWQHGDSAASFALSLETRINETDIINK